MKKIFFIILTLISFNSFAQVPEGIPYQAVARDAAGIPLSNHIVNVRFSILDSIATGLAVYTETHTTNTNNLGSFTVNLGKGTPVLNSFTSINWGLNSKFLKVEIDTSSGSNYIEVGTQQMMSVPYALYAFNASFSANGVPVGKHGETCLSCWGKSVWSSNGKCPQISSSCNTPNLHSAILNYGNLVDIDGNLYKTIKIGDKIWMAENLKTKHYANGDSIITQNYWQISDTLDNIIGRVSDYCSCTIDRVCINGFQYNYYAAIENRNVCPTGWHVSTKSDWDTLLNIVSSGTYLFQPQTNGIAIDTVLMYKDAGMHLRPIGNTYWNANYYGQDGDNLVGFSAVPTGWIKLESGIYWDPYVSCSWWSTNSNSLNSPVDFRIWPNGVDGLSASDCGQFESEPNSFSSIRCVKD